MNTVLEYAALVAAAVVGTGLLGGLAYLAARIAVTDKNPERDCPDDAATGGSTVTVAHGPTVKAACVDSGQYLCQWPGSGCAELRAPGDPYCPGHIRLLRGEAVSS